MSGQAAAGRPHRDAGRAFYTITLKNFATPWTNRDQTVFAPLNDYTATVIGMVRDDVPFNRSCPATSSTWRGAWPAGLLARPTTISTSSWRTRTSTCEASVLVATTQSSRHRPAGRRRPPA